MYKKKNKKICVYTCITGNYDNVKELAFKEKGVDYFLFTNNKKIVSFTWNVIYIENNDLDNIRLARKIKILGHEKLDSYDITVWVDGAIIIRKSILEFIDNYCDMDKFSLVGFKHRERDCIYQEALECVRLKKENKDIVKKQMLKYRNDQYPEHNGLIESTVLVRKYHDSELKKVMEAWFFEICEFSYRDQLSFNYIVSKSNLQFSLLEFNVFDNEYFFWENHILNKDIFHFNVYFGNDDEFDYDGFHFGSYEIKDDYFIAKFKINKKCSVFKIEFSNGGGILFSDLEVVGKNITSQNLVNYSQYFEHKIFDNGIPTLFIHGNFKKNDRFIIKIKMEFITEKFYLNLLKRFNESLIAEMNSNSNKYTILFRKISNRLRFGCVKK